MSTVRATPVRRTRGERVELECGPMVHGGVCVSRTAEGDTLMVDGGITGERCTVELRFRKGGVWFAQVVEVLEASPHRVTAPCPYFGACGGCQLQHVAYPHQLELKRGIVLDAMRRARAPVPENLPVHGMADPWSYRWRGEFQVVRDNGVALGFNRLHSWSKVAIEDCLIHHPSIRRSLPVLRGLACDHAGAELTSLHVTVGEEGEELVLRGQPARALTAEALDAVQLQAPVRLSAEGTTLHWRDRLFRTAPDSFIQVNWTQMDVLYGLVLDALEGVQGTVVDAYSGIGVLSVAIAEHAARVVCIEENRNAARLGVLNARMNGVADRVDHVAAPVEEVLHAYASGAAAVVLDPPRAGCDSRVTGWLAFAGPPLLVYVSCDPATLARDLHVLAGAGPYRVERLDAVDMFAQTWHIECVAVLRRAV